MQEENKNIINHSNDSGNDSVFTVLIKLSVKTLFYLFLIVTILSASFMQIFPLTSARFYRDLEDYPLSIAYAKKSVKRTGDINALTMGIEMSESLLYLSNNDKAAKSAATDLLYFTDSIAMHKGFNEKAGNYDKFYRANATSIAAKVGLYSYKDYVYSLNTAARSVTDKTDKLLFSPFLINGIIYPLNEVGFITINELEDFFADIIDGKAMLTTDTIAILLNQFNQNIIWGDAGLLYDDVVGSTTKLYDLTLQFVARVPLDSDYSFVLESVKEIDPLKQLYLLDSAVNFYYNMNQFFKAKASTYEEEKLNEQFTLKIIEEEILLSNYYEILLNHYNSYGII